MKFLVDEDLPRSTAAIIREFGHEAIDVRDIHLRGKPDQEIAAFAKANGFCVITADGDYANILQYPPHEYKGLVVLDLPHGALLPTILGLIREFLGQSQIVGSMSGKLVIVSFGRIRIRG
jgi:hypothetical protein